MQLPQIFAFADEASPLIDGQIAAMQRNQLQGLEIRNVDGENVSAISAGKAREVRQKLDGAGLRVWSIGSPIGKIDIEQDDFEAHLDLGKYPHVFLLSSRREGAFPFPLPGDGPAAPHGGNLRWNGRCPVP